MSSGLLPPRMRRKQAACSKVLGPRPVTSSSCVRAANAPLASRPRPTGPGPARRRARTRAPRRGVQIDAHLVDAVLDDGIERLHQLALVDVVLVLAHADALGIDLHQLGQ